MVVKQTLNKHFTSLYHICWRVCSPNVAHELFPVVKWESWLQISVMISPFSVCIRFTDLELCLWINHFGLFAWINQTVLSLTYLDNINAPHIHICNHTHWLYIRQWNIVYCYIHVHWLYTRQWNIVYCYIHWLYTWQWNIVYSLCCL